MSRRWFVAPVLAIALAVGPSVVDTFGPRPVAAEKAEAVDTQRPSVDLVATSMESEPRASGPVDVSSRDAERNAFSRSIGVGSEPLFIGSAGQVLRVPANGVSQARIVVSATLIATTILAGLEKVGWSTITSVVGELTKHLLH
jgi:hypothetical protein